MNILISDQIDWSGKKITINDEDYYDSILWLIENFKIPNISVKYENPNRYYWSKIESNETGLVIKYQDSRDYWYKKEYNDAGLEIRFEDSKNIGMKKNTTKKDSKLRFEDSSKYWYEKNITKKNL